MTTAMAPEFYAPGEEAREHSDLNPEFNDGIGLDGTDPDAPYGRKADGTPKAKPGRPAGTPDSRPRTRTATRRTRVAAAAPKKREQRRSSSKAPQMPDYRPGITGLLQLIAAPLAVAGMRSEPLKADAAAIVVHAEPLAEALQETAETVPAVAQILDRVLSVGPYGALLAAVMPLAVQVAANHKLLPAEAAAAMGAMAPEELVAAVAPPAAPQAA